MKRAISRFFAFMLVYAVMFSLAACNEPEKPNPETSAREVLTVSENSANKSAARTKIEIKAVKGPAALGMLSLMSTGGTQVQCDIGLVSQEEEIEALVSEEKIDVFACSLGYAAKLYEDTDGGVKLLAISTLGTLYLLDRGRSISTVSDLRGKTVMMSGEGTETQYIFENILSAHGLTADEDVRIVYEQDDSTVAEKAVEGEEDIVLLSEPYVRELVCENTGFHAALDITYEWDNACEMKGMDSKLAQYCIAAKTDFVEKNVDAVDKLLDECAESADFVNSNVFDASKLASKFGVIDDDLLARWAIPGCNVTCITGNEMESMAKQNLQVLFDAAPDIIGGNLPDDDFYYLK